MLCMYNRFELSGKGTGGNETEISDSTGTPKASTNNQTPSFDSTVPPTNVTSSNVTKVVSTTTGPGKSFMNLALFKIVIWQKDHFPTLSILHTVCFQNFGLGLK